MFPSQRAFKSAVAAALTGLVFACAGVVRLDAQQSASDKAIRFEFPKTEPSTIALPLPEDRGLADLAQTLRRLHTTASVLYIVAHPDDEDGALLTYLARGLGARVTLFTLTRGEGGQNAMTADTYDAMGLMRTQELLKANEYIGAKQLWGTEADFGFSKTQAEAYAQWGHDRVLYDAVLAVRQVRPQIIVATFVGGVSDGHGQHQVSGEVAQEVFKAAGDPKVFPEQLKDGLEPWQPLAVYSRAPFARITSQGIYDYATGKWAPAKFHNYITGEWLDSLSADASLPVGTWDPALGRSYAQIAREGWGMQKSQNGGANPTLSGQSNSSYHLWAVAPSASAKGSAASTSLFDNSKVSIDTSVAGLAKLVKGTPPGWLKQPLAEIDASLNTFENDCHNEEGAAAAHKLAPIYRQTLDLYAKVKGSNLDAQSKAGLELELGAKIEQFESAFKDLLGLDLAAFTTNGGDRNNFGPNGGGGADEGARSVSPGQNVSVRVHTNQAVDDPKLKLERVWLESHSGSPWKYDGDQQAIKDGAAVNDFTLHVQVPEDAAPTAPFFTRPNIEQPYYDISNQAWRNRSFAPWPLAAWAEFTFDGLPIRLGQVVQTMQRVTGPGGIYEPLVVTPAIGVRMDTDARILPLDGSALPVKVIIHAQYAAKGTVSLKLPEGWHAAPTEFPFNLKSAGDTAPIVFSVTTDGAATGIYSINAIAQSGGRSYQAGWRTVGYQGLLPYNQYLPAELKTRKVDVKVAQGLRVGYVMGPGDLVPDAIDELGIQPHMLNSADLSSGDFSEFNVLVIGIRAYSTRPELTAVQPQLDDFVRNGGTLIVEYQGENFPAPLPLSVGRRPETVVDERTPVKLLEPDNPLLTWPNKITPADFDGWVEERGHAFLVSWDPGYTALTETADQGQDPQRGGLLITHPGKGTYIYVAFALYRQLPELVPGSYRLLANMLSAGKAGN